MLDRLLLVGCRMAARPLRSLDIDARALEAIVAAKLTADRRRVPPSFGPVRNDRPRNWFAWQLAIYTFVGLLLGVVIATHEAANAGLTVLHSGVMMILALALLSDFSTVLLDTTDVEVLAYRPVSARTILGARLLHVIHYVSAIVLALGGFGWLVWTVRDGVRGFVGFGLALIADASLILGLVTLVYVLGMRLLSPARLRSFLLWSQIAATLTFLFGFQLMPRLLGVSVLTDRGLHEATWPWFYPPAWAASLSRLGGIGLDRTTAMALLGVAIPTIAFALTARLSRLFRPAALSEAVSFPRARRDSGWLERWARRLTRNPVEAAYFAWTWRLVGRDAAFKLRVYPSLIMSLIFPPLLIVLAPGSDDFSEGWSSLPGTDQHLLLLYFACLALLGCVLMLRMTDRPEAGWVHFIGPQRGPGDALVAAFKVVLLRFILPLFAVASTLVLAIWGARALGDIAMAGAATFLIAALETYIFGRRLPFTEPASPQSSGSAAVVGLMLMVIPATFGLGHWALRSLPLPIAPDLRGWLVAPILALCALGILRAYRSLPWQALRSRARPAPERSPRSAYLRR